MTFPKKARALTIVLCCIAVALLVLLLPISIPADIDTVGKVVPSKEWLIFRDAAGRITATVNNRISNSTESLFLHENERNDAVIVDIDPLLPARGTVRKGDTVGRLLSAETERELAQLEGELARAVAASRVSATGEKSALVSQAERQLEQARTRYEGHLRIAERMRQLSERGILARQDYETVENASDGYSADIRVAEAALESVRSGAKPAEQDYARAGETSLAGQVRALCDKLQRFVFVAPFAGTVLCRPLSDTLFHLAGGEGRVVVMSVPWSCRGRLHTGQAVAIDVPGADVAAEGRICSIGNVVQTVAGRQVLVVSAFVERGAESLPIGLQARCAIRCPPVTLLEELRRVVSSLSPASLATGR